MIRLIEAANFRSLRYVSQEVRRCQVMVGANATGKSTFLDVVHFLGDILRDDLDTAIEKRTRNWYDLTFGGEGGHIELAIEMFLPDHIRKQYANGTQDGIYDLIRYEVKIGMHETDNLPAIIKEHLILLDSGKWVHDAPSQLRLFPREILPEKIVGRKLPPRPAYKRVLTKKENGNATFYPEAAKGQNWTPSFNLGPRRSGLANLPADEEKFPAAVWARQILTEGIQWLMLDSMELRRASPPGKGDAFLPDGSNLPWVIRRFREQHSDRYEQWVAHLRTALPDIEEVRVIEREDDRHAYLKVRYSSGIEVPSWFVSDGTLRLLALTLPAYLPEGEKVYLIEEPENGIHPLAIEAVWQSLSTAWHIQVLMATHSPVLLGLLQPEELLCFAKTPSGATDIINGREHPQLKEWKKSNDLSLLFASGILTP
ncbi:MAG: ATP-binding protein [Bacteroidetes bacterium]|nr:MAG: ATP-binding protein [Bacteroidota bacterium]